MPSKRLLSSWRPINCFRGHLVVVSASDLSLICCRYWMVKVTLLEWPLLTVLPCCLLASSSAPCHPISICFILRRDSLGHMSSIVSLKLRQVSKFLTAKCAAFQLRTRCWTVDLLQFHVVMKPCDKKRLVHRNHHVLWVKQYKKKQALESSQPAETS